MSMSELNICWQTARISDHRRSIALNTISLRLCYFFSFFRFYGHNDVFLLFMQSSNFNTYHPDLLDLKPDHDETIRALAVIDGYVELSKFPGLEGSNACSSAEMPRRWLTRVDSLT